VDHEAAQHEEQRHAEMPGYGSIRQNRDFGGIKESADGVSPEDKGGRVETQPRQARDFWSVHPNPFFRSSRAMIPGIEGDRDTL
jgi:hypothetical protein